MGRWVSSCDYYTCASLTRPLNTEPQTDKNHDGGTTPPPVISKNYLASINWSKVQYVAVDLQLLCYSTSKGPGS